LAAIAVAAIAVAAIAVAAITVGTHSWRKWSVFSILVTCHHERLFRPYYADDAPGFS
jgi:hypothetical protein